MNLAKVLCHLRNADRRMAPRCYYFPTVSLRSFYALEATALLLEKSCLVPPRSNQANLQAESQGQQYGHRSLL
jgi:hypothetical protein